MTDHFLSLVIGAGCFAAWVVLVHYAPKWLERRKYRQMERFYYGPKGDVSREVSNLADPGIHRPYWR